MTQAEARRKVENVHQRLIRLNSEIHTGFATMSHIHEQLNAICEQMTALEIDMQSAVRHFIHAPNARPATKDELAALCAASNVVAFRPAA